MGARPEPFRVVGNGHKIQGATQLHGLSSRPHQGIAFGETVGIFNAELIAHHSGIKTFCGMQVQFTPVETGFTGGHHIGNRLPRGELRISIGIGRSYLTVILQGKVPGRTAWPGLVENGNHGDDKFDGNEANTQGKHNQHSQSYLFEHDTASHQAAKAYEFLYPYVNWIISTRSQQ